MAVTRGRAASTPTWGARLGLNPADARLAVVLLATALLLLFGSWLSGWLAAVPGETVFLVTTADGATRLPAERDGRYEFTGPAGVTIVEVIDGRARLGTSPCDEPAWHGGWIERPGQRSVCLPNRVVLEVISEGGLPGGDDGQDDLDGVTH